MYWYFQEKVVFNIVFFIVFVLQISSLFTIRDIGYSSTYGIAVIIINIIVFLGMIKYAQWIWKKVNLLKALGKIIKYEAIFLFGLIVLVLITKIIQPDLW